MENRKYPVDTQTFDKIIDINYIYLDKMDLIEILKANETIAREGSDDFPTEKGL